MKKRSHKLTVKPDYRFLLLGISSHENDYHLCWAMNQHLNFDLQKRADFVVFNTKLRENQSFSMFTWEDEEGLLTYYLLSNRCDNGFLIEEFRNIDFLLQVHGEIKKASRDKLLQSLNKIDVIITSFIIDPQTLKSRDRLLIQ